MIWIYSVLIVALSALLWRVRGGLRIKGKKLPANKIWYAVFFAVLSCINFCFTAENFAIAFTDCYASYQLYGWGAYLGALLFGGKMNRDKDAECELIDDILYACRITFGEKSAIVFNFLLGWTGLKVEAKTYWLRDYGHAFGFIGTSLTGLIITFLWGLFWADLWLMLSGLGMGVCYWLGGKINNEGKNGWNIGEIIAGSWFGLMLAISLLWR
jgi:hypothetical protein